MLTCPACLRPDKSSSQPEPIESFRLSTTGHPRNPGRHGQRRLSTLNAKLSTFARLSGSPLPYALLEQCFKCPECGSTDSADVALVETGPNDKSPWAGIVGVNRLPKGQRALPPPAKLLTRWPAPEPEPICSCLWCAYIRRVYHCLTVSPFMPHR